MVSAVIASAAWAQGTGKADAPVPADDDTVATDAPKTPEKTTESDDKALTPAKATGDKGSADKAVGTKPASAEVKKRSLLDEVDDGQTSGKSAWDVAAEPRRPTYPYFEYHGYFRFRPDVINNGHLGIAEASQNGGVLTTSAIQPPLSLWPQNNDPAINPASATVGKSRADAALMGANMRFRLEPTMHLSEQIRVKTTFDIMDNYVLGSSPDYAGYLKRPDVPLSAFATSATPGTIAIKEAYAEWKTMLGLIRVGRQSSQWGLGILSGGSSGTGWDGSRPTESYGGARMPWEGSGYNSDYGTYVDRVAFLTKAWGTYVTVFWDYANKGFLGVDPTRVDGQVRDLGNADDVTQFGVAIFQKPLSPEDVAERRKRLQDDLGQVFDWGIYGLYRTQANDIASSVPASQLTLADATKANNPAGQLVPRGAKAMIGDFWARYENRMAFSRRLVVEGEFAGIYGHIDDTSLQASTSASDLKPRDLQMWGFALKSAFQNEGIGVYFDVGAASGDDTRCFGVYGAGNCSIAKANGDPNTTLTAFKFHKDYRVDSLLFSEVIGAVTNAVYVKPTFSINAYPWYAQQLLGLNLSALYARAVSAEGTPGNNAALGTELEAKGFFGQKGLFQTSIAFSYLFPGEAFTLKQDWNQPIISADVLPSNAWRLMGNMALMF